MVLWAAAARALCATRRAIFPAWRQPGVLGQHALALSGFVAIVRLARLPVGGLARWNQLFFAVADQIRAPHFLQGFTQQWPVFRIVVAQEGLVQAALAQ